MSIIIVLVYIIHLKRDCRAMLEERSRRVFNVEESISAQLAFQMVRLYVDSITTNE